MCYQDLLSKCDDYYYHNTDEDDTIYKPMNKNKTEKTPLHFLDAATKAKAFAGLLIESHLTFTLNHIPEKQKFVFTGVQDADSIKVLLPQTMILEDAHKRRYAELVINYE